MAMLHAFDLKDEVAFRETISDSLQVDPEFEQTWMLLGDVRSSKGDVEGAIEAYQEALEIKRDCNVYHVLGTLQAQQSLWEASVATLEEATEWSRCANSRQLWDMYRVLAIAYANQGEQGQALQAAMQGLELAPEGQQEIMQDLVASLQGQPVPAASEDAGPSEGATP
jgi:tetratricopeptide (TPR) repeat protein